MSTHCSLHTGDSGSMRLAHGRIAGTVMGVGVGVCVDVGAGVGIRVGADFILFEVPAST